MRAHRWPPAVEPDELGAVVHGPVVLARSPGIVAALRCVFAHTAGLSLRFVLRRGGAGGGGAASEQQLPTRPRRHRGGNEGFDLDANFWVDELPIDGRIVVTVSWPQAGLAESRTELQLRPWTDADVLRLL